MGMLCWLWRVWGASHMHAQQGKAALAPQRPLQHKHHSCSRTAEFLFL